MEELLAKTIFFLSFTAPFMWMSFALPSIAAAICAPKSISIFRLVLWTILIAVIVWALAATFADPLLDLSESLWHKFIGALLIVALLYALLARSDASRSLPLLLMALLLANATIASDTGLAIAGSTLESSAMFIICLAVSGIVIGILTTIATGLTRLLPLSGYLLFLVGALITAISLGLVPRVGDLYYMLTQGT